MNNKYSIFVIIIIFLILLFAVLYMAINREQIDEKYCYRKGFVKTEMANKLIDLNNNLIDIVNDCQNDTFETLPNIQDLSK